MKAFFDPLAVIWLAALGFVIGRRVKERVRCRRGVLVGLLGLRACPRVEVLLLPARSLSSLGVPDRKRPGVGGRGAVGE